MNVFPVVKSRDLLFESKCSSMLNQASLYASSLSTLNVLRAEEVGQVMTLMDDQRLSRVFVTDREKRIVYDNTVQQVTSEEALAPERQVEMAQEGNNVFFSELKAGAVSSRACIPVMSRGSIIGAVFLYEYDTAQAALIDSLRLNLLSISFITAVLALLVGLFLGYLISRRTRMILTGIRGIGAGRYDTRIADGGLDELAYQSIINVVSALQPKGWEAFTAAYDGLAGLPHKRVAGKAFARDGFREEVAGLLADGVELVLERRYLAVARVERHDAVVDVLDVEPYVRQGVHHVLHMDEVLPGALQERLLTCQFRFPAVH